jgi:hypothetical protein
MPSQNDEVYNEGASTSTSAETLKQDKKKSAPWIEKYRPQVFEEIMGEKNSFSLKREMI